MRIFREIIRFSKTRLLARLRFTRSSTKDSLATVLRYVIDWIQGPGKERNLPAGWREVAKTFVTEARVVIKLLGSYDRHRTSGNLLKLVEGVHNLSRMASLYMVLEQVPETTMAPDLRGFLLRTISKIAHYRSVAVYLVRSAEVCPRLRRASVVMVDLDGQALGHPNSLDLTTDLGAVMSRLGTPVSRRWSVKDLCIVLRSEKGNKARLSMHETALNAEFQKLTLDVLANSKVHAEVQILAFLDARSMDIPPRVICSSKKACFLCNAFVRCHGAYHIPRSHGKLYPHWRLPCVKGTKQFEGALNRVLEIQIEETLGRFLSAGRRILLPAPHESTVLTLPASTLISSRSQGLVGSTARRTSRTELISSIADSAQKPAQISRQDQACRGSVQLGGTRVIIGGDFLILHIEFAKRETTMSKAAKQLTYDVKWLSTEQTHAILSGKSDSVYSVQALKHDIQCKSGLDMEFYLYHEGQMLMVQLKG